MNRFLLPTSAFACLSAMACQDALPNQDPTKFENVVVALPFSGTFAFKAEEHKSAMLMAVERFESAGGRPNRPVRLLFVDVSGDAAAATAAMQTAMASLTVNGNTSISSIISSSTGAMKAVVPFALQYKVPHMEVSSGSGFDELDATTRGLLGQPGANEQFFAPRPLCLPEPEFTADFVFQRQSQEAGWDKVGVINAGDAHDVMHEQFFISEMKKRLTSFTPLVDINLKTAMKTDKQAIAEAIAAGVNVLYFHITGDAKNIAFFQAARDLNFQGKIVTCGMARIPDVLRVGDPDVSPYLAGRLYFQMRGLADTSGLRTFNDDLRSYVEKGGETDIFSASSYDAAMMISLGLQYAAAKSMPLGQAILAVSTGEGTNQLSVGPDGVNADVIAALKRGEDINYQGASSTLEFTPMHPTAPNGHDHFGYMTRGLYYVEQIERVDANTYQYRALSSPVVER